jgi:nucleoside-diphosphate kinase
VLRPALSTADGGVGPPAAFCGITRRPPIDLNRTICYSTGTIAFSPCHRPADLYQKGFGFMQHTLAIVKPDGVARGLTGEVVRRIESNGLKIIAMKMIQMTRSQAEGFYVVHKARPFFASLTGFMCSGPVVVMILQGDNVIQRWRDMMGATNFKEAAEGTIRREFATDIEKNVVHGSDAPETAAFETSYFFNAFERMAG